MSASKTRSGGAKGGGRGPKGQPGKGQNRNRNRSGGGGGPKKPAGTAGTAKIEAPAADQSPAAASTAPPTLTQAPSQAPPRSRPEPAAAPARAATLARSKLRTSKESRPRGSRAIVRHIDPRSALKVSVLFYLSLSLALFVATALLWTGANAVGLVSNIEAFMDEIGFTDFQLRTGQFLKASLIAGVVLTGAGSVANFLLAMLYNLISDTVGGIKVVLSEDKPSPKP